MNIVLDKFDAAYAAAYAEGSRNESASLQNLLSIRDEAIGRLIAERDAFTAVLVGMVRLHFDESETFEACSSRTIAAVDLLVEAGRLVIDKDVRPHWIRARWIEEEPNAD